MKGQAALELVADYGCIDTHTQSHVGTHTHNYLTHALHTLLLKLQLSLQQHFLKKRSGSDCNLRSPPCRGVRTYTQTPLCYC